MANLKDIKSLAGKSKGFVEEFKEFITKGNVMDMAVGVIIGAAFSSIISSLVDDIIMPCISRITGGIDFSNYFIALDGGEYKTLAQAKEVGAVTLNYGNFITVIINFLLMALVIFIMLKFLNTLSNKMRKQEAEEEEATTKECPYCLSEIPIGAKKCSFCTSDLSSK